MADTDIAADDVVPINSEEDFCCAAALVADDVGFCHASPEII
jgi:hypothetical protein